MKNFIIPILLASAGVLTSGTAATIQLMPEITGITGSGFSGTLTQSGITASDVNTWLGSASKSDGWYTTTGNADMQWGSAGADAITQTVTLPSMPGTNGVCAGLKMTLPDMSSYEHLAFSFTLTPPASSATYTYSIWYGNNDGSVTQLFKESGAHSLAGGAWNASYSLTAEQIADIKTNGNGKLYVVIGGTGGSNGQSAVISDLSLEGTQTLTVPEASTASLFLMGLTSLMFRRKVKV